MKEKPILMSTENVKAILEGRKTQTRRMISKNNSEIGEGGDWAKLCWDGSAIHTFPELGNYTPIKKQEKAPLPFVDDGFWEKDHSSPMYLHVPYNWVEDMTVYRVYCKYDVGDRLWVRETCYKNSDGVWLYKADNGLMPLSANYMKRTVIPSIHMPRWASRITLEITEIRVERLQEITPHDCVAEGIIEEYGDGLALRDKFEALWNSLNPKYPWESNPFVWVLTFKVI